MSRFPSFSVSKQVPCLLFTCLRDLYLLLLEFPRAVSSPERHHTAQPCDVLRVSGTSTDADGAKGCSEAARMALGAAPLWDIPHGLCGLKVELVFPPRGWRVLMGKRETVPGLLGDPPCGQTAFPRVVFNLIVTHVTFSLFLSSFSSGADISRMPRPHTCPASLTVPCQRGTIEDLTLTLRHYSKSLVYLQVPCWCCEFYEFG